MRILQAIYEQDFIDDAYGFRPDRSCHDALRTLSRTVGLDHKTGRWTSAVGWTSDSEVHQLPHRLLVDCASLVHPTHGGVAVAGVMINAEYFKSTGKGWQTHMDEVLKAYVDSHR